MFDTLPSVPRDAALDAAQCLYIDHGHRLAEAARFVGGSSAEARVIDLGVRLAHATRMTTNIRRVLWALYCLLSLEDEYDCGHGETIVLSDLNLTSPQIADICLVTDLLGDLLETIAAPPVLLPPASQPTPVHLSAPNAA